MVTRSASMVIAAFALAALACGASTTAGSSTAQPESPHPHDFVFTEGQKYEKNPEVKLAREYWIIGVTENGARFIVPRPDGDPRIVEECRTRGPLSSVFENAFLCNSATQSSLSRVNALTISEARQVSTFLHSKLRFEAIDAANGAPPRVDPYALTSDLLDICKAHPDDRNGVMKATCDHLLGNEASSSGAPEIGHVFTLEECQVMAKRLNELYGIP